MSLDLTQFQQALNNLLVNSELSPYVRIALLTNVLVAQTKIEKIETLRNNTMQILAAYIGHKGTNINVNDAGIASEIPFLLSRIANYIDGCQNTAKALVANEINDVKSFVRNYLYPLNNLTMKNFSDISVNSYQADAESLPYNWGFRVIDNGRDKANFIFHSEEHEETWSTVNDLFMQVALLIREIQQLQAQLSVYFSCFPSKQTYENVNPIKF